ncbi:MAG TPA: hypothetical protein VLE70_10140 [Anaerolineae bacterium]|nr:hypothetical protein [Anaerolineae bacterium]
MEPLLWMFNLLMVLLVVMWIKITATASVAEEIKRSMRLQRI